MNAPATIKKPGFEVQTLDTLSPALIAAIRALPSHEDNAPPPIDGRRPASFFLDEAVFQQEQAKLFRRLPVAVTLSAMLPEPGSLIAHNGYGVPLILTRAKDGVVRAFLNACQHKGATLVEDCEQHKMGRLSCPYHAWTYNLDGSLIGVPREETFKNFDKSDHTLVSFPCAEKGGVVWIILDRDAQADFSSISDEISDDLTSLRIPKAHVYGRRTFHLKANWKLVLEPFLESYHVNRLHAATVGPMFADAPGVIQRLGDHLRGVSGKVDFKPELLDTYVGEHVHKHFTIVFNIFPGVVIITSPYYISVMVVMPTAADRTSVDYYMLTQSAPDNEKAAELYARSYEMIQKVFGTEDFRAAEISQAGLSAGAVKELRYCGLERNIMTYYETLDRRLEA